MNKNIIAGIFFPNIVALIVMLILAGPAKNMANGPVILSSTFILLPYVMGLIAAFCWRKNEIKSRKRIIYALYITLIALFLSAFFMGEGYICLLIVAPLLYGFVVTGVMSGKYIFRKRNNRLNLGLGVLIITLFVSDALSYHECHRMVSDRLIINAPPEKIWNHVVAFDSIRRDPEYWLFKIGMPKPVATLVDGYHEGAGRKCIFNDGIVFTEKMIVYEPGKELTFDIIEQPVHPELMDHILITRGQFILHDNGDNTTTLTGNSWYTLFIFPSWYFDIWAESITRNVHLRVMNHIKELSENTD